MKLASTRPLLFCLMASLVAMALPCRADEIRQEDVDASLIQAVGRGDMDGYNRAVGLGGNIHATDRHGNNAVLAATEGQQHALLRRLLDQGVNPDIRGGSGFTPLTYAALHGEAGDLRLLLKAGADPNSKNAIGSTPLHLAAEFGHDELIGDLVGAGARVDAVNSAGETPLVVAIRAGRRGAVDRLLALGARREPD